MDQYGRRRLHRFLLLEVRRFLNTTSSNDQTIKCKQRGFYNHLSFKGRGPSGYIYIYYVVNKQPIKIFWIDSETNL